MKMKKRMFVFLISFFSGFILIFSLAPEPWNLLAFAWAFALMLAQFLIFRCSHCHKTAIIRPSGLSTPFVGSACRHCGELY